jgi:hypothetical protein
MTTPANFNVRDALLIKSDVLPAAASTTKNGTALDLGNALTARGARLADCELLLSAPALTTTMLPDTKTMTYSIESSVDSAFTSPITLAGSCIVQTGAGGAGAAAATFRLKVPSDCARYIRAKAVSGANVTDSSTLSMKLELLF